MSASKKPESGYSSRSSSETANGNGNSLMSTKIRQTKLLDFFFHNDDKKKDLLTVKTVPSDHLNTIVTTSNSGKKESRTADDENRENSQKISNTSQKLSKDENTDRTKESFKKKKLRRKSVTAEPVVLLSKVNIEKPQLKKKRSIAVEIEKLESSRNFAKEVINDFPLTKPEIKNSDMKESLKRRRSRRQSMCVEKQNCEKVEPRKLSYKKFTDEKVHLSVKNSKTNILEDKIVKEKLKRRKSICVGSLSGAKNSAKIEKIYEKNIVNITVVENHEDKCAHVESELMVGILDSEIEKNTRNCRPVVEIRKIEDELSFIDPLKAMLIRVAVQKQEDQKLAREDLELSDPEIVTFTKRPHENTSEDAKQPAKRLKINETELKQIQSEDESDPAVIDEVIEDIWYVSVMIIDKVPLVRFLVKWDGFPPTDNTLEPFEHVAHVEILQEYVKRKFETHQDKIDAAVDKLSAEAKNLADIYEGKPKKLILNKLKQFDVLHFRCNLLAFIYTYEEIPFMCLFMRHLRSQCVLYKYYMKFENEKKSNGLILTKIMKEEKNMFKISVENKLDFEPMPFFEYMRNVNFPKIEMSKIGCNCDVSCIGSSTCCPSLLGLKPVYDIDNRLYVKSHQMIVECNQFCNCDNSCPNRPRRTKFNLCAFKTKDRGWALKTLEYIPAAAFVIEYTGELIKMSEAKKRTREYKKQGVTYLFDLDYNEKNEATFSLDATHKGNLSRFINHSCNANLQTWPATSCNDSPDTHRLYYFSLRHIRAGEELTVDYSGGVIRPKMKPPKDAIPCKCNSDNCRGFIF